MSRKSLVSRLQRAAIGGAVALTAACASMNGDLAKGEQAYERGAYEEAVAAWQPLAERGNARAQTRLADMFVERQGVPRDYVRAYMWYTLAADRGDAQARRARDELKRKMNFAQVAAAESLVREWRRQHRSFFWW